MDKNIPDKIRIHSEMIEPTMAYIIGRLFAQCEHVKDDPNEFFSKCQNFWYAMRKINNLAGTLDTPHFSIAAGNELQRVADYIKENLGIDPILDKHPQFEF